MAAKRRAPHDFEPHPKPVIPSRRRTARDLAVAVKAYFVYMMSNRSRVVLYTGVTNDLARRVWEHQNGTIKGFTKQYRLTTLVYHETYGDINQAIDREKQIKSWRRSKKNALVETLNPKWDDLSPTLDPQREVPRRLRGSG
ncbi:MAG: GIY-YIG nuclease family protein [Chthoniobacterales bacterium]|nr:GIY-YIG nuclease family protein [Chthoniobacterales bacterium]